MAFNQLTPELVVAFEDVVGATNVLTAQRAEADVYADYGRDHTEDLQFAPDVVLRPGTAEEVAAILGLCHAAGVPVTARGAGTGLSGGALPVHHGVVLSTELLPERPKTEWLGTIDGLNQLSFGILQAARTRMSKTEYISCPSCGRTLFDLQETTAMIRQRTDHLKGVKIGIMGCIVNGPGEMADADYGYVGVGKGKIALYRGQEVIKKSVPEERAVDELIELMREDGKWVEKEVLEPVGV